MAESFDVVFHGDSEAECITFIRAVRQHAKENSKIRDNWWIADELYNAFDGKALTWYLRLPVAVRGDWELLQQALLARWITSMNDDVDANVLSSALHPTPAAAPGNWLFKGFSIQPLGQTVSRVSHFGALTALQQFLSSAGTDLGLLAANVNYFFSNVDKFYTLAILIIICGV